MRSVMAARGYHEVESRTLLLSRNLDGFESQVDRQQMQIRRQMQVEVTADAPTRPLREAFTVGGFDLTRFDLVIRGQSQAVATALFRSMEPSGTTGVGRAAGLIELLHRRNAAAPRPCHVPAQRGLSPVPASGDCARRGPDRRGQHRGDWRLSEARAATDGARGSVEKGLLISVTLYKSPSQPYSYR